jgi:hypothetical protein
LSDLVRRACSGISPEYGILPLFRFIHRAFRVPDYVDFFAHDRLLSFFSALALSIIITTAMGQKTITQKTIHPVELRGCGFGSGGSDLVGLPGMASHAAKPKRKTPNMISPAVMAPFPLLSVSAGLSVLARFVLCGCVA